MDLAIIKDFKITEWQLNTLFIEFRDPLFGIIVFFVLIFVIAFFSYWWGRYKTREDHRYLDRFLRQFRAFPSENELDELMGADAISEKSWLLMAQAYYQSGDYEKCITIYHRLIERENDPAHKRDALFLLGRTYFKAGFLERSEKIFLQILKQSPRTPQALRYLILVYEQMHQYDKALDALGPLSELGKSETLDRLYFEALALIRSTTISSEKKAQTLIALYEQYFVLDYVIFEYLFRHHSTLAWKHLDLSRAERLSDILWHLPEAACDFDIISKSGYLRELFTARGLVDLAQNSPQFELDVLIKLQCQDEKSATLQFEYYCSECKQAYPFVFHRCPNCYALDSVITEPLLTKELGEENHSFE